MKKLGLFLFALLMALSLFSASAQDADIKTMARYFPADTSFFFAARTDEGYIDQLDSVGSKILNSDLGRLNRLPVTSLRSAIDGELQKVGTDLAAVYTWLGDYAAFGVTGEIDPENGGEFDDDGYFVVELKDSDAAVDFLAPLLPESVTTATEGNFTVFSDSSTETLLAIGDNLLLIYPETTMQPAFPLDRPLSEDAGYQDAIANLTADPYNILFFLRPSAVPSDDPAGQLLLQSSGPLAVGFTILDDRSLVIDSAQLPNANAASVSAAAAVNPDFARYIPADASLVVHANSLTNLYANIINAAKFGIEMDGGTQDPEQEIRDGLAQVGIDLDDDILSWTTGDYAIFTRVDTLSLVKTAATGSLFDFERSFDFGIVIEATDAEKASAFAETITRLLRLAGTRAEGVTITTETISDVVVTVIGAEAPMSPTQEVQLDILLGASDDVFFIATRPAVEVILNGDGTLVNKAAYQEAQTYLLPNASSVWFADGPGLVGTLGFGTIGSLAMMGPAIGNVFDEITAELEGTTPPTPAPPSSPFGNISPETITTQFQAAFKLITSSSISSAINDDGVTLLRFVLTFNDQPGTIAIPEIVAVDPTPAAPVIALTDYSDLPTERLSDGGFVLGDADAPITLVEFADFACSHCQAFKPTVDEFIDTYVRTGQARYEFRIMPTAGGDLTRFNGNIAACLTEQQQGAYWLARDLFFALAVEGQYNRDTAKIVADQLDLDYDAALTCAESYQGTDDNVALSRELGVVGTPTVLVRYGDEAPVFIELDGRTYDGGGVPFDVLAASIEAAQ